MIKTLFWNLDEQRPRALWRILGFIALGILAMMATGALVVVLLSGSGQVAALVALTGSVWAAGRLLDRRRFVDFGLRLDARWWLDLAFGLALGVVLMGGIYLVEHALGWVRVTGTFRAEGASFAGALLSAALGYVAVGFYEELVFRGYLVRNLAEGFNTRRISARQALLAALLLSSLLFGLGHAFNPGASWISTVNISLAGIFLGIGYVLTGRLGLPVGLHISWNFAQGIVFGFPVSGTTAFPAQVLVIEQGGPGAWTGGAFGPEAGLLGLLAMIAGTLLTVGWVRWRYRAVRVQDTLAEAPPPRTPHEIPPHGAASLPKPEQPSSLS